MGGRGLFAAWAAGRGSPGGEKAHGEANLAFANTSGFPKFGPPPCENEHRATKMKGGSPSPSFALEGTRPAFAFVGAKWDTSWVAPTQRAGEGGPQVRLTPFHSAAKKEEKRSTTAQKRFISHGQDFRGFFRSKVVAYFFSGKEVYFVNCTREKVEPGSD